MIGPDMQGDLRTEFNVGYGLMLFIPIVTIVGGVVYMYYTFSKSYSYGWSDAEEKHEIAKEKRFCFGKDWCEWDKMYEE